MSQLIIIAGGALLVGLLLGWVLRHLKAQQKKHSAEARATKLITDAKAEQQELLLGAKEKAHSIIDEAQKEERERRSEMKQMQERLENRESMLDQKLNDLEKKYESVQSQSEAIESEREAVAALRSKQQEQLEQIAGLSTDQAREQLFALLQDQEQEALTSRLHKLQEQSNEVYDEKARTLLTQAIQRCGMSHAAETTSTVVNLPSDDMKGRIIGKEGRNIKRIEELTGVEVIVDDTPGAILLSCFSPVRRHLAKRTIERLMEDGRIHPARIEEVVELSKKQLQSEIKQAGEEALYEMGITGVDPKLIQILGRLRYRTSYGQNVLRHSIEVGTLAGLIAEELGANVAMARKAGLFHDIGKALDHDIQGTHCDIGRDIGRKFGFNADLADAAFCHHDDHPPSIEGIIVKVADSISGGRPGARKDSYEQYVQRLEELEQTASSFDGVDKVYAIQAGREIRVFVQPDAVNDMEAYELAKNIAAKIEAELKYPGEIKVNLIRDKRITAYAR